MRSEPNLRLDPYRSCVEASPQGAAFGAFVIERAGGTLRVISSGIADMLRGEIGEWEHVSVSRRDRCPTWEEMCFVKDLFWREDETVMQFHPAKSAYVNVHPFCLHLWRHPSEEMRLPPIEAV